MDLDPVVYDGSRLNFYPLSDSKAIEPVGDAGFWWGIIGAF